MLYYCDYGWIQTFLLKVLICCLYLLLAIVTCVRASVDIWAIERPPFASVIVDAMFCFLFRFFVGQTEATIPINHEIPPHRCSALIFAVCGYLPPEQPLIRSHPPNYVLLTSFFPILHALITSIAIKHY